MGPKGAFSKCFLKDTCRIFPIFCMKSHQLEVFKLTLMSVLGKNWFYGFGGKRDQKVGKMMFSKFF